MDHVLNTEQIPWTLLSGAGLRGCEQRRNIIANDYTDAYSADVIRVAPGGWFIAQAEDVRCSISVLAGVGKAHVGEENSLVMAGAVIKISDGIPHKLENLSDEFLVFLAIYDPPQTGYEE
ncbi:cupin domain-containing protein [Pusillimonas noertemannii]|uniref:Mannose-6-phosphate isomerase-like protein (Cupin superfamily) n=1 Tax=Pusillimonas noertemannii TaxID=305977 RepID=A0A2U1CJQ1_9BURK|nr:hypothetical protein [Pusillimonas noertemannii]NYT69829.1 hypothetical protein [Pusillimonas noertemannii]PVY61247.1 mannose-6-phosphate isomerase-like protein (cupin superfamily) [Pusillimonas noertemannii]TFL09130.1 hypothetical protein CSC72_15245 [Pusillimonas noertemannii]